MPTTFYTKEEYEVVTRDKRSYEYLLESILNYYKWEDEKRLLKSRECGNASKLEDARYNFIPLGIGSVMKLLNDARALCLDKKGWLNDYRFLDAGCGIGWIVKLARGIGFNASGIELDENNVEVAKTLFNLKGYVKQGDILKHKYPNYDIIYYYCPIFNKTLQMKFERKVEDEMIVGSFLIPCMKQDRGIEKDKRFELVSKQNRPRIYKKVKEAK